MKPTGLMSVVTASGLQLQKSRLEFLSLLLIAMVQAKTVTASLVGMIESEAQPESLYRRAQRCFQELHLSDETVLSYALR